MNPQHIERRLLTPLPRRDSAGLDDERGVAGDLVTLGGVPDVADVKMTGEK
jgi:hypothetical protein